MQTFPQKNNIKQRTTIEMNCGREQKLTARDNNEHSNLLRARESRLEHSVHKFHYVSIQLKSLFIILPTQYTLITMNMETSFHSFFFTQQNMNKQLAEKRKQIKQMEREKEKHCPKC